MTNISFNITYLQDNYLGTYVSMNKFMTDTQMVPGLILLNFEPIRDIKGLLVACKNEEDPMKNEGARLVTTLFINF